MPEVLIVGGGSIGERHLRCFGQIGCQTALCEIEADRRARLIEQYDVRLGFSSLEEAARRPWDAVVVCTPAHLHVPHALSLLGGGTRSLLIEKPLATCIEDAQALLPHTSGAMVGVAYVLRASPLVQEVRQVLSAGQIGDVLAVVVESGQHFPTFRPAYRDIYYRDRRTGGGAVQDAATHMFDLAQYLAGPFDWIFCDYEHQALEGVVVEDTVQAVGRSGGGRTLVSIALNQFMAPNETTVRLNGRAGSIEIRFHEARWGMYRHGEGDWSWNPPVSKDRDELFRIQARRFRAACEGREPMLCSLAEAMHSLEIQVAALASQGTRRIPIGGSSVQPRPPWAAAQIMS